MGSRLLLFLAIALAGSLLHADQSDDRLIDLFSVLQTTESARDIAITESQIWEIWLQHANADVQQLILVGTQRMNAQRYAEAMVAFNRLTESFPDYAEGWNKRATLHYVLGNLDASVSDIEKTLELEPRHFGALSGLGMVYIQRKELNKAKQAFENLIEVHPNSPNAKQNLERVKEQLRFSVI
ncbi:MAG: tetratricopeptide repeat protein [Gammaproteobacteria bacterium]|nr:tetratricopeptide repeat protein [Gammaproteobacteria bacterium]MBL4729023.1 tetratricopeptide repeat protein [Gammaproteobacteria bacterium]